MTNVIVHVNASEGEIMWDHRTDEKTFKPVYWCQIHVIVPAGSRAVAVIEILEPTCRLLRTNLEELKISVWFDADRKYKNIDLCDYDKPLPVLLSHTNFIYFGGKLEYFRVLIRFNSTKADEAGAGDLPVRSTSKYSGYLTSPWYDGMNASPDGERRCYHTLTNPLDHAMISFPRFEILKEDDETSCHCFVDIAAPALGTLWRECRGNFVPAQVYNLSSLTVTYSWNSASCDLLTGFKMLFSFHPAAARPRRTGNGATGVFNCSVEYYLDFQEHLDCNIERECSDGSDETSHCSFSSPECPGAVAAQGKCYFYVKKESVVNAAGSSPRLSRAEGKPRVSLREEISRVCREHGGDRIADIRSDGEFHDFMKLFHCGKLRSSPVYVGTAYADPWVEVDMYKQMWTTAGNMALYNLSQYVIPKKKLIRRKRPCLSFNILASSLYKFKFEQDCEWVPGEHDVVCEKDTAEPATKGIDFTPLGSVPPSSLSLVLCPDGHVTHVFLWCDVKSHCGYTRPVSFCPFPLKKSPTLFHHQSAVGEHRASSTVGFFPCDGGSTKLPYGLVCDFVPDCSDHGDERFCAHPRSDNLFLCSNGQNVETTARCNFVADCKDGSDEEGCEGYRLYKRLDLPNVTPPVVIDLDGKGFFRMETLPANASCPETHYRCASEPAYCLPVYTRCNEINDCLDYRDEKGCRDVRCSGFYRCRASSVCVHVRHLCDGWPQCPQRDDELLCDFTCPPGCLCQGHAFLCHRAFPVHRFSQLRYLDASGSGVSRWYFSDAAVKASLSGAVHNQYLIYLNLSRCSLSLLADMVFPNLLNLDLSRNKLKAVNFNVFLHAKNLRELSMADNPLTKIYKLQATIIQKSLKIVDLSNTHLRVFSSAPLENFFEIQLLNLSGTAVHTINASGFDYVPHLKQVDLRGSPLEYFPADLFRKVTKLSRIDADNYKLCCKEILPAYFLTVHCHSPADETSSCADLLRTGLYRQFLWLVSVLSLLGNFSCFVFRACLQRTATKGGFNVFVTSLSLADFLMGVYMTVIGVADAEFRGVYLYRETSWTRSAACSLAGFLSLVSCEVSTVTVWFITLDRFIVLHFPFSQLRFQRRSATVACLVTWFLGVSLASVPLLERSWDFYSQTGICIPLPVTRREFEGRAYSYGVLIVFNFIMFLLIAGGQAFIYWTIQKSRLKTDNATKSRDSTVARRLITVAVTDFMCWFPIGLCGLLASAGCRIPGDVSVAMAIFVLPLNSALNPFLYTINMVMEKQRKVKEDRLVKYLEASIRSQTMDTDLHD